MTELYNQQGIDAFVNSSRPIPGQSLVGDPDTLNPWEGPPEFTNFKKAFNYLAEELLDEDNYVSIVVAIGQGVPISDITLQLLQRGFQEGKWNPDLLMMLIEPTMYLLMALSEKAGIEYRLYGDQETDLDAEEEAEISEMKAANLSKLTKDKVGKVSEVPSGILPKEIIEEVENLDIPQSLLEKTKRNEENQSLLQRQE
tara:strand:+ start:215 stop:811 length:597 start_codon:yes stop_codon:yes gene_type:complete